MSEQIKESLKEIAKQAEKAAARIFKIQTTFEEFLASQSFKEYRESLVESDPDALDSLHDELWSVANELGGQIDDYEFWVPSTC